MSTEEQKNKAHAILEALKRVYPDAHCELDFKNPLELLVGTILAAQCTDVRVNMVTKTLFQRCKSPQDYASIALEGPDGLEEIIKPTGFYRNKAKALKAMGEALVKNYGGEVPNTIEGISSLPGAGRKTANVVLGNAFGINAGFVVDTHVSRLSQRLGLSKNTDALKIEKDLMEIIPQDQWTMAAHYITWHGRRRCKAKKPECSECEIRTLCPSSTA
jgi:endonuclease III